jgi:uncharacterized Tic20 family protein
MSETRSEGHVPVELSQDEQAYAGLAHALMISTWWIGPLRINLLRKHSRFVSFHALQTLCWQIIYTFLYVAGMAVFFAVRFSTALSVPRGEASTPGPFPIVLFCSVSHLLAAGYGWPRDLHDLGDGLLLKGHAWGMGGLSAHRQLGR